MSFRAATPQEFERVRAIAAAAATYDAAADDVADFLLTHDLSLTEEQQCEIVDLVNEKPNRN